MRLISGNPSVNVIWQSNNYPSHIDTGIERGISFFQKPHNGKSKNLKTEEAQFEISLFKTDNVQNLQLILRHKGA